MDRFRLDGRTALVTGGGRGLGAATARALADAGAEVVVVGRSEDALAGTVEAVRAAGGRAGYRVVDVTLEREVEALFSWADETSSGMDIVVNNAAVAHEAAVTDVSGDSWDQVLHTNTRASFLTARELARRESDTPRVVINVSSLAAFSGVKNQVAYSASKGAVESMTRALAVELAQRGIRVNAVAPGYFRTDMPAEVLGDERARHSLLRRIPQRRVPDPSEIGPTMVYLASEASAFLTGAVIHLDGGYTAQ
jgi:NAD(P)-dependent dehydrogenase (short-subunit alcohol dehydrogenase family)